MLCSPLTPAKLASLWELAMPPQLTQAPAVMKAQTLTRGVCWLRRPRGIIAPQQMQAFPQMLAAKPARTRPTIDVVIALAVLEQDAAQMVTLSSRLRAALSARHGTSAGSCSSCDNELDSSQLRIVEQAALAFSAHRAKLQKLVAEFGGESMPSRISSAGC
jgi:hypothetical protein